MAEIAQALLEKNRKIDPKVVSAMRRLEDKLPASARTAQGSDYRISPPLGGQSLALAGRAAPLNRSVPKG